MATEQERVSDARLGQIRILFAAHTGTLKAAITQEEFRRDVVHILAELREHRMALREKAHPGVCEDVTCPECYQQQPKAKQHGE